MNKVKIALLALFASFSTQVVKAEEVTEDFESVTITDLDSYGRGKTLSNGWIISGTGFISNGADSYDYGFWSTAYNGSSRSLTAQYGSSNNSYVVVPVLMTGDVTFFYRKTSTSSRNAGKVYAYKVTESEGVYTIGSRIFMDEEATTSWQKCTSIKLAEPTMIAFKLVRAAIDDVTYNTASLEPHTHDYATAWSSDAEGHWHACISEVGICDAKKVDVAAHDGAVCSVCGYEVAGIKAFPWTESFNGVGSGIPEGWDNSEGTTTVDSYKWNVLSAGGHDGKCVRFDSYNNNDRKTNTLATPYLFIPETGEYELDFWYKNPKGGDFSVKVAEYGSAEKTVLAEGLTGKADWTELKVNLAAYAGKIVKLYFCGTSNYGSGDAYIYLDDVTVKESVKHNHDYADVWSHDNTSHWHACLSEVGDCDAPQLDLAAHTLNAEGVCTVCGFDQPYMEDFEAGIPASWTNKGFETVRNPTYGNGTQMAYAGRYADGNTLTTPLLYAKEGSQIDVEALLPWNDETLTMEYSYDRGETWAVAFAETPAANNTLCTLSWTAPQDGYILLRFSGRYNYIDNVCGFKLAQHELTLVAQDEDNTYYATFSNEKDVKFADGATVYAVSVEGDQLVMTEVSDKFVPANTGVLVACTNNKATYFNADAQDSSIPADNMLVAASVAMEGDYLFYKLAYNDYVAKTDLGFYWGTDGGAAFKIKSGAYLAVPNATLVKGYKLSGTATSISHVETEAGKAIFNLQGQRIQKMQKGINIVNGRKVIF